MTGVTSAGMIFLEFCQNLLVYAITGNQYFVLRCKTAKNCEVYFTRLVLTCCTKHPQTDSQLHVICWHLSLLSEFDHSHLKLLERGWHWYRQTTGTQIQEAFYKMHLQLGTTLSLKSTIFRDITPCSLLSVNPRFGGTYRLLATCFHVGFLLSLFFRLWRWRRYVPQKHWLTLNGLHGVISQKMVLFITTAVRTSNPTTLSLLPPLK
jgi:hypothetical protein